MPLSEKSFFNIPFPDAPVAFDNQPQAVRDAWGSFAKSVPIGWADYKTILRPTRVAYDLILTSDNALHEGNSPLSYPPEISPPVRNALARTIGDATIGNIVSLRAGGTIPQATNLLIWATAPAATPGAILAGANQFLGVMSAPAGSLRNTYLTNLGTEYVAQYGSLAARLGEFVVLWSFEISGGSLSYAGSWTLEIKEVAAFGTIVYFPMTEPFGPRQSIAQPAELKTRGDPLTQVAGPIDFATQNTSPNAGYTEWDSGDRARPDASYTVAAWVRMNDLTVNSTMVQRGFNADNTSSWALHWIQNVQRFSFFYITDLGVFVTATSGPVAPTPLNRWVALVATYDADTEDLLLYVDGTLSGSATTPPGARDLDPTVHTHGAAESGAILWGALAEVSYSARAMTAGEVLALWNSGAGLRYPYD